MNCCNIFKIEYKFKHNIYIILQLINILLIPSTWGVLFDVLISESLLQLLLLELTVKLVAN